MTRNSFRSQFLRASPARRSRHRFRRPLAVEVLEDRTAPATIGYYDMGLGQGNPSQVAAITAAGHTPVQIFDLSPAELSGIDVLDAQNPNNGGYGAEYVSHLTDVENAVLAGMALVIHDRYVDNAESILPGSAGFNIIRDFSDSANIDVLDNTTLVTNGPGGIVDNTTLDGGISSSHGFTFAGSLPASAALILSTGDPTHIVTFAYGHGAGTVVYSSIPLDFYRSNPGIRPNFNNIYAPNVLAYGATNPLGGLSVTSTVPANNSVVSTSPTQYIVNVSNPLVEATLDAADFEVNGIPASSFSYTPGTTSITFTFASDPVTGQGLQTMHVAADAFTRVSDGDGVKEFNGTFRYDVLLMEVISTVPADGSLVTLPFTTLDLNFNEAYDLASADPGDFTLSQGSVSAVSQVDADTLRLTLSGVTAEGTLTVNMAAGAMTDLFGNLGAAFSGSYLLDFGTVPYPTPLEASAPAGSLIYQGETQAGTIGIEEVVYLADFESGDQGFVVDNGPAPGYLPGQWHLSTGRGAQPGHSANTSFYYGHGEGPNGGGTYQLFTTTPTQGTITSPAIALPTGGPVDLTFNYVLQTRVFPNFVDFASLQINDGSGWTELRRYDRVAESSVWTTSAPVDLTAYAGATVQLRWSFDTIMGPVGRGPEGWYVDDVRITTLAPTDSADTFTIDVDPGQTITVVVSPDDPTLQASVTLLAGATGTSAVASSTASGAGEAVILQAVATRGQIANNGPPAQTYRIVVAGANDSTGEYSVQVILNAAVEDESNGGAPDDTLATAQTLEGSFVQLHRAVGGTAGAQPARGAVLGTTDSAPAAPPVVEVEPNNSRAEAQSLDGETFTIAFDPNIAQSTTIPHVTIVGTGDGTFDYYSFTVANAGDVGIFDIDFTGSLDSFLRLYDSNGNQIAANDDSSTSNGAGGSTTTLDSFIQFTFSAPGQYVIEVGRCCVGTLPSGSSYTLQLSLAGKPFVPPPPDVYSFRLQAGESATVVATALGGGSVSAQVQDASGAVLATGSALGNYVAPATGTYYVVVGGGGGVDYSLVVTRNGAFDTENNDDIASAQEVLSTQVAGAQWVLGHLGSLADLFAISGAAGSPSTLYALDPATGAVASTIGATGMNHITGMDRHPITGELYAVNNDTSQLVKIDPSNGAVTVVGSTGGAQIPDISFRSDGTLFAWVEFGAGGSDGLATIDLTTGAVTIIPSPIGSFRTGIAFDSADNLYVKTSTLFRVNPANGAIISSVPLTGGVPHNVLEFSPDDVLYTATRSSPSGPSTLQTINVTTGQVTTVGITPGVGISALAFGPGRPDPDFYEVTLAGGKPLEVETSTPGAGAGAFDNSFDPLIRVYDATGNLLASADNSAPDGRNARLQYNVPKGRGGTYFIEVTASPATEERTEGEYILSIKGNVAGGAQYLDGDPRLGASGKSLDDAVLGQAVAAAVGHWKAAGIDTTALNSIQVRTADLVGSMLGHAFDDAIVIDQDAAGHGWSFGPGSTAGTVNLFSTVVHELGHVLGFEHVDPFEVMQPTLRPLAELPGTAPSRGLSLAGAESRRGGPAGLSTLSGNHGTLDAALAELGFLSSLGTLLGTSADTQIALRLSSLTGDEEIPLMPRNRGSGEIAFASERREEGESGFASRDRLAGEWFFSTSDEPAVELVDLLFGEQGTDENAPDGGEG